MTHPSSNSRLISDITLYEGCEESAPIRSIEKYSLRGIACAQGSTRVSSRSVQHAWIEGKVPTILLFVQLRPVHSETCSSSVVAKWETVRNHEHSVSSLVLTIISPGIARRRSDRHRTSSCSSTYSSLESCTKSQMLQRNHQQAQVSPNTFSQFVLRIRYGRTCGIL